MKFSTTCVLFYTYKLHNWMCCVYDHVLVCSGNEAEIYKRKHGANKQAHSGCCDLCDMVNARFHQKLRLL